MNNNNRKITIFFVVIIVVLIAVALVVRFEGDTILNIITNKNEETTETFLDNGNGIYRYRENLAGNNSVFIGCSLKYIDNLILVDNDNYYVYRQSCVGTYYKSKGKVSSLEFKKNVDNHTYILFNNKKYIKNNTIYNINLNNPVKSGNAETEIVPENYLLLLKEIQNEGEYFSVDDLQFKSIDSSYHLYFKYLEGNLFNLNITDDDDNVIYSRNINNFESAPMLKVIGPLLIIVYIDSNNSKYSYSLKAYNGRYMVFNLDEMLPITVDNVTLGKDSSIFISYNNKTTSYTMLIGKDKKLCNDEGTGNEVYSYEFEIKYNYSTKNFNTPKFIKKIYGKDGCSYVNSILEG